VYGGESQERGPSQHLQMAFLARTALKMRTTGGGGGGPAFKRKTVAQGSCLK